MRRLNLDALLYCLAWAVLAILGFQVGGLRLGLILSAGLFIIIMPLSAFLLSRTGSFTIERSVRWSILAVAALGLLSYWDLHS